MGQPDVLRASLERNHTVDLPTVNRTLWVCFLNLEGYEIFADAIYTDGQIKVAKSGNVPKDAEVSTIQFWEGQDRVTVLPTGMSDEGDALYQTVETIVEAGEVPTLAAASLARRIKMQPYRDNPEAAIYPLLQLPPFK